MNASPPLRPRARAVGPGLAAAGAALACAGCAGGAATDERAPAVTDAVVVVGVTSNLRAGHDFDRLGVAVRSGARTLQNDALPTARADLVLPLELPIVGPAPGDVVAIDLEATSTAVPGLSIVRRASTRVVAGRTLLLPMSLDALCIELDAPGGTRPPACAPSETCAAGACVPVAVDPATLADYTPDWAQGGAPDACRPAGGGAPEVTVGQGRAAFSPVDDCSAASPEPAQIEAGPQGGHHVWVAVRTRNVHQSGATTTVRGHVPGLPQDPRAMTLELTYQPAADGTCEAHGIRYQLDTNGVTLADVLGKELTITVEVRDTSGATVAGERCVRLSSDSH